MSARRENGIKAKKVCWNITEDHRRKFPQSYGQYLDSSGRLDNGERAFWGEWEPPSYVTEKWEPNGCRPRFLYSPFWVLADEGARQNTNPWAF
jgi:hypothetical protein